MSSKSNTAVGGNPGSWALYESSGGTSGDMFDGIIQENTSYLRYSDTHTVGVAFEPVINAVNDGVTAYWNMPNSARAAGRMDLYLTTYPPASTYLGLVRVKVSTSGPALSVAPDGALTLSQYGGTVTASTVADAVPLNTWCRIEWDFKTTNTGTYEVQLYPDRYSTSSSHTLLNGAQTWNVAGNVSTVYFGSLDFPMTGSPYQFTNINANDTGLPGPYLALDVRGPVVAATVDTLPVHDIVAGVSWENTAQGGVVDDPVTEATSGGDSGDPFVVNDPDGRIHYRAVPGDTAGNVVIEFDSTGDPADMALTWAVPAEEASSQWGGRAEFSIASAASGGVDEYQLTIVRIGDTALTAGFYNGLQIWDYALGEVGLFTTALQTDTWYRIEWAFDFAAGIQTYDVRLYPDRASTDPLEVLSGTAGFYGTEYTTTIFGPSDPNDDGLIYLDNVQANTDAELPGPYGAVDPPADPPPGAPIDVTVPVALVAVDTPAPTVPVTVLTVAAPAALVEVKALAPTSNVSPALTVDAPLAGALVDVLRVPMIAATVTPTYPTEGLVVPSATPRFKAAVVTDDPTARLEFQYSSDDQFTDAVTLTQAVPYGLRVTYLVASASAALTEGVTWRYRARVVNDYDATDWTAPVTFTVSPLDGDALAGGTWTVDPVQVPMPHLWWTRPDRGAPGDEVVCIGTGFGPNTVSVSISALSTPATLYTVTPTGDAYTEARRIDRDADVIDCGHQRVTFEVPPVSPPAGPLYVDGS